MEVSHTVVKKGGYSILGGRGRFLGGRSGGILSSW